MDDEGLPEESGFFNEISRAFALEKFEIREEPFPGGALDPLTYYVGESNRLKYECIAGNVSNCFSVVGEDERQRRAKARRRKMLGNWIVFGVLLVVLAQ